MDPAATLLLLGLYQGYEGSLELKIPLEKEQQQEREENISTWSDTEPLYTADKETIWNTGPSGSRNTMAKGLDIC